MEGHPMFMDQQNQHCKNGYITENNLYVQCNPHQNSNNILQRDREIKLKVHVAGQKTSNRQSNFEQKVNSGGIIHTT
jgi:hypothetical protein